MLKTVIKADIEPVAETLTRAFTDYVMMTAYFPDIQKRIKITRASMKSIIYRGLYDGEVYATSDRFEGVIVWKTSGSWKATAGNIRSVPVRITLSLLWNGIYRLAKIGTYIDERHKALVPYPHMYLETVGVDPAFQGQGFASQLIVPMLERLDAAGMPCYLETLEPERVSLYEHFGFRVLEESEIPGTPLTCWAMLRESA